MSDSTLSGTVVTAGTSAPIPGAWVVIMRSGNLKIEVETVADGTGAFTTAVAPGSYYLYLIDPAGTHAAGFDGAPREVTVATGASATVVATMAPATGAVSGTVWDATTSLPLSGAWVFALNGQTGAAEVAARTDSSGRFTLDGLRPGAHWIAYLDPTARHLPSFFPGVGDLAHATQVMVAAGTTVSADASLPAQSTTLGLTAVSGTVRDDGGNTLSGVIVVALRSSDVAFSGATTTSNAGRYRLTLPSGSYKVGYLDPAGLHDMEWQTDRRYDDLASAASISVPSTVNANLTPSTGTMRGTVRDQGGTDPIPGAWVVAIGENGSVRGAVTAADGTYTIGGLRVGTYRAAVIDTTGAHALQYWNGQVAFGEADTFNVTPSVDATVSAELGDVSADHPVLGSAVGWWDAASGLDASGRLPDLSGNGNDMDLHAGDLVANGPAVLAPDATRGTNLFSPGWDDMYLDTAAPATPIGAIDVAWEADTERLLGIDPSQRVNWIAHQGSTAAGTFAWAVGIDVATHDVVVAYSQDGTTVTTVATAATVPESGTTRTAVTLDPATGTVDVHRQPFEAAVGDFDLPYDQWTLLDSVPGTGPVSLFASPAPIRHSSTVDADRVGDDPLLGWFKALYRLRIRADVGGPAVASLDAADIPAVPEWSVTSGLPPVGPITTAATTSFAGAAGEQWTITDYRTTSYPILIVNHPVVLFGNGAYGEVPADDDLFDVPTARDSSVWIAYGYARQGSSNLPLLAHKGPGATDPGYAITKLGSYYPSPVVLVSDGVTQTGAIPPLTTDGQLSITGLQLDGAAPFTSGAAGPNLVAYTNGVPSAPTDLSALGSLSDPGAPLRVASWSTDGRPTEGFAFIGLAVFDHTLTQAEIDQLPAEFALG